MNEFRLARGEIVLPRFETTYSEQLNDTLKEMGMRLAFDRSAADFSRMTPDLVPGAILYISDVEHKTWVKVDEEGTGAAAADGFTGSLARVRASPFVMIVDHPFFFAITEQQSGALLFAGVVMDPTLTGGVR